MQAAESFTENRVLSLPQPASGYTQFYEGKTPGFGLRVTSAGARSYTFDGRVNRRTFRITIGDVRTAKLAEARKEAKRLATLCDRGIDPRQEKAAQQAQAESARLDTQRRDLVFAGVWDSYVTANRERWGERHVANHCALAHAGGAKKKARGGKGLTIPGPLASLMTLKLAELSGERIASWLKRESRQRPTSTAQAFRALRAFIRWTQDVPEFRGIIPADAYSARAVRDVLPRAKTKDGDCLQMEQLPGWFNGVRSLSNPVISAYLQALLLTGARREELATLRWEDVDFTWNSLTIRDKVEGRRTIPLTPFVAALLKPLPRKNDWVFSSVTAKGGRMVEPRTAHNRALARAEIPHVTLHGLRRSFGTLAEWVELPTGIVAQIQGHAPSALAEKHYRRRPLDLLRMWHEKLEAWILEKGGVPFVKPNEKNRLGVVNADGAIQSAA